MKLEDSWERSHRYVGARSLHTSIHEIERDEDFKIFDPPKKHVSAFIDMKMTCMACPMQYEGKINGVSAYYRDRHGIWSLEIYEGELFESKLLYEKNGISSEIYGYKGMLDAEKRIMKCAIKFARKHPEYEKPFLLEEWMYDNKSIQPCDY